MPTTRYIDDNLSFLPSQQWTQQAQSFPGLNSTIPSGIFLYGGTGSSHASSSESEFSTPETFQESSNSPIRSPDTTTIEDVVGGPYLQLVEPPVESCRFRYPTEMKGTHGSILGISTLKKENARKKIFPSVKLHNYHPSPDKKVIIRCSLTTADEDENARFPHVHQLKGKGRTSSSQCKAVEIDDPIDIMVSSPNYQAVFGNMTILYIKKDDQLYELVKKKKRHMQKMYPCNKLIFTEIEDKKLLDEAKEDISQMNLSRLNTARLKFEALELGQGQIPYKELCPPIYSNPIKNIKNTQFSDLRICRIDKVAGSCLGKDEVFIFVEKVNKKDIKVRFFELNENEEEIWEAYAEFQSEEDVHYQYAIAFRTPRYKDVEITENVKVYFELVRPTNNSRSVPKEFEYTPNPDRWQGEIRKRPRCESPTIPTTVGSLSRPSTSQSWNFGRPNLTNELNPPDLQSSSAGSCSTEDEYSILEEFLKDLDLVPESPQTLFDYSVMMEVDQERLASRTSSHSSVSEVLSSFPSGDSDFIRQTMTSDAIKKLGDCYGATGQTVQELLSLITKPDDEYHTDGVSCRTVVQPEMYEYQSSLTATHQMSVAKPEMDFGTPIRFQSDSNNQDKLDNRISGRLTRENVVSKVDKALNVLLGRRNRIQEKGMKRILQAIFTKEVGGNDDRVLHIMASNPNFSPLMLKFLNVLKMYDITERVVDLKNNRGQTPLHLAAEKGSLQTIALLVDTGANVNIRDISLNTPLHLVANREQNDAFHAVGHIIERNPDLTIYNEDGLTPLHLFVLKRKSDVISSLIVKSEDRSMEDDLINQQDRKQGNTALHMAVQKKYLEIVNLLLNFEDRIDVNARNFDDKTPLAYVSGETVEDIKMQDLLLANKADPLLVHSRKVKSKESDELKNEFDHHEDDDEEFEEVDETLPSYAQDWKSEAELKLMDTQTICSVCPVLDESNSWKKLFQKLDFEEDLLQYLELKWSPTLYLLKTVAETMPHISPEMLRDILIRINPECKKAAQFIDDMILCKMGVF